MHCIEENTCDIAGTVRRPLQSFSAPRTDSAPGELCPPCPHRYAPAQYTQ